MKKDFNIVTLHRAKNFGAALQAYALKTHLCKLGYRAAIYDAEPILAKSKLTIKTLIVKMWGFVVKLLFGREFSKGNKKFDEFAKKHYDLNKQKDAKVFLAGSDQVWNPIVFNPAYYLNFCDENSVKASYAASLGVSVLPGNSISTYNSFLSDFDYISVREHSAKEQLNRALPEKEIRVDLDPTFLISKNEWCEIAENDEHFIDDDYILLYVLHVPENINALCKWLRKELNAKLLLIDNSGLLSLRVIHDKVVRGVGPCDFLSLVRNAKAIITTSFHGIAFSLIFEKEFYSIINPLFPSRVENVLSYFGVDYVSNTQNEFCRQKIDYDNVKEKIFQNQESSDRYFNELMNRYELKNEEIKCD